jgi:hypothetical protein
MDRPAVYAAVYVRPGRQHMVDYYAAVLPSPHLLEWNVMNNGVFVGNSTDPIFKGGVACDLDGVLCEDANHEDDHEWRLNALPLWLPRTVSCRLILTARLESWRPETVEWLTKWRVKYERLEMFPGDLTTRRTTDIAAWKAGHYSRSPCGFMMESSLSLGRRIRRRGMYSFGDSPVRRWHSFFVLRLSCESYSTTRLTASGRRRSGSRYDRRTGCGRRVMRWGV